MDQKQFERLQMAVQYAVDDERRQSQGAPSTAHRWDQGTWGRGTVTKEHIKARNFSTSYAVVCPTSGCVAGTIVIQNGDHMVAALGQKAGTEIITDYCIDTKGDVHSIEARGRELIGLEDCGELEGLFAPGMEVHRIVEIATSIASGHGYELEVV